MLKCRPGFFFDILLFVAVQCNGTGIIYTVHLISGVKMVLHINDTVCSCLYPFKKRLKVYSDQPNHQTRTSVSDDPGLLSSIPMDGNYGIVKL